MNDLASPTHDEPELDESPTLKVACATERGVPTRYWKQLRCYEMSHSDLNAKPATLRKWREAAPEGASFIARIDPKLAALHFEGDEAQTLWRHALLRQQALEAEVLLLHTPATYRPSHEAIAALRRFFGELERPCPIAWRAEGLWEESETYLELCEELNLLPVIDPLMWDEDEPRPTGAQIYWRVLGGQGLTPRVTEMDLERLIELSDELDSGGWVVFTSPRMEKEAARFNVMTGGF